MLIKKQFAFARILLISFPLVCLVIICQLLYSRLPMQNLKNSLEETKQKNPQILPHSEWQMLFRAIIAIPAEAEAAVIYDETVIASTENFLETNTAFTEETLENLKKNLNQHSFIDINYPLTTEKSKIFIISKINLQTARFTREVLPIVLILLIIIMAIFNTIIYKTARKIFSFILNINNKTKEIYASENAISLENKDDFKDVSMTLEYLDSLKTTLEEAKNSRSRFIMGISHDLRTPISVIKGYTEAMKDGLFEDTNEKNEALDIITAKLSQLESMINTLINYERLKSKDWQERLTPTLIKPFITSFCKNAKGTGTLFKKEVSYKIKLSDTLKINMNEQLAFRAFENIFSNALRYTENGGNIHIEAVENIENVIITFSDSGCGIEEKDLKNIFEIFFRASSSRREEGMGIGLSVVKNIMEIHEWKIEVKSKKNEGTTFTITMPKKPKINFMKAE